MLFVLLLVGGWRFAALNGSLVSVHYLVGEVRDVPLWLALLCACALGAGLVAAIAIYELARLGLVARRFRKAVHGLEAEIHELRTLPLASGGGAAARAVEDDASLGSAASRPAGRGV